jgi:Prolyl oligopeptidase, N-terminal beta-propeller domain
MIFPFLQHRHISFAKAVILLSCISFLSRSSSRRFSAATASAFQSSPLVSAALSNRYRSNQASTSFASSTEGTCLSSNTKIFSTSSTMVESPPIPRREEDGVVYAGSAPEGWDHKVPRQSNDSTESMMTPPVAIPNPYGWMRDDKREKKEVLDHLNAENAYSKSVIKHLEVSFRKAAFCLCQSRVWIS